MLGDRQDSQNLPIIKAEDILLFKQEPWNPQNSSCEMEKTFLSQQ